MIGSVGSVAQQTIGAHFRTEQTGGGCEALVATLEGGATLVLAWEFNAPVFGDEGVVANLYAPGHWEGDGDVGQDEPLRSVEQMEMLTEGNLPALILAVLS